MKFAQAMRTILSARGYTQTALAEECGVRQEAVKYLVSKRADPKLSTVNRYVSHLGYRVVLEPVGSRLPEGSYVIDGGE